MVQKSNLSNLICSQVPNRSVNHTSKNCISRIQFLCLHMAGKISLSFQAVILPSSATERIVPTFTIRISNVLSYVVTFRFYSTTIMRLLLRYRQDSNLHAWQSSRLMRRTDLSFYNDVPFSSHRNQVY